MECGCHSSDQSLYLYYHQLEGHAHVKFEQPQPKSHMKSLYHESAYRNLVMVTATLHPLITAHSRIFQAVGRGGNAEYCPCTTMGEKEKQKEQQSPI